MPLKAVLFDLDDTLYDTQFPMHGALRALQRQYECLGSVAFDELEAFNRDLMEHYHLEVLNGLMSLEEARTKRIRQILQRYQGDHLPVDEVVRFYRQSHLSMERITPGALDLLKRLRAANIRIAIISNNQHEEQVVKLKRIKLDGWIDLLVTSESAGVTKPDPRIFELTLQQLGCQPHEVVMVGDSWSSDIKGACAVGIRAFWLNRYEMVCPEPGLATEIKQLETLFELLMR